MGCHGRWSASSPHDAPRDKIGFFFMLNSDRAAQPHRKMSGARRHALAIRRRLLKMPYFLERRYFSRRRDIRREGIYALMLFREPRQSFSPRCLAAHAIFVIGTPHGRRRGLNFGRRATHGDARHRHARITFDAGHGYFRYQPALSLLFDADAMRLKAPLFV